MADILLINPSYSASYSGAKASIVNPVMPTLGLATIAAENRRRGHNVEILDLCFQPYRADQIKQKIIDFKPDIVGISATTPLMNQLRDMSVIIKDVSKDIFIVGGGAHPSSLPYETLQESMLDAICAGEADYSFAELADRGSPASISGLVWRNNDEIIHEAARLPIPDLDDLPMPAWDLYDPEQYKAISRLLCRRPPLTMAEFSRGCVFKCDFCASKITMALGYRKKSPERCAEEVEIMHRLGFGEFMLADDIFTSDQNWAGDVCKAISKLKPKGVDMAWSCTNGIRVESANDELFERMYDAGCYRVSFGFESGNDEVLKLFGKGGRASVEQGVKAVNMARKAGIDTSGFFLLGLSPDNETTMHDTINYARKLPLDMMKFGIAIAFPGTPMFNDYSKRGLIRSYNWDDYFIYTEKPLFAHPTLTYDTINVFMRKAYRKALLFNPRFIARRLWRGIKSGEFFWDVYYGIQFFLMPATGESESAKYAAENRWPHYDFETKSIKVVKWQVARKKKTLA